MNSIGTVPVYFPYAARDQKTGLYVTLPGCVKLDGASALSYVRSRGLEYYSIPRKKWVSADAVPDIDRITRQQEFMRKLAGLAVQKSLNDPLTANDIADRVLENLKIDDGLSKGDIFELIDAFRTINPNDQSALEFQTLPWKTGPNQAGQDVLYPDEPAASQMIDRLSDFSGSSSHATSTVAPSAVKLKVLNASSQEGAASATLAELTKLGFRGAGEGNDQRGTVEQTEIRYQPGAQDKARTVFRYVRPDAAPRRGREPEGCRRRRGHRHELRVDPEAEQRADDDVAGTGRIDHGSTVDGSSGFGHAVHEHATDERAVRERSRDGCSDLQREPARPARRQAAPVLIAMSTVGVVGAGYVGLTTAACLAHLGHEVVCADVDKEKVAQLSKGEVPILEEGLDDLVAQGLASRRLRFVVGAAVAARDAEFVFLCVQTPQR